MCRINCIAIAFALMTGRAAAQIPAIGADAGDGFKVAAHWAFHYRSNTIIEERAIGGPLRSIDAPLNWERLVIGEADVTEEVNKSTGQIRAVIRGGRWSISVSGLHYTDKYGDRVAAGDDAEEGGEFKHAAIGYGYDEKLKKPTVHFAITSNEGAESETFKVPYHELDENLTKAWVSGRMATADFQSGVSGGCDVPFKASYLYYRKRTPEDSSSTRYTEIVIERSARNLEAEIKPADDYKNWVPTLDGSAAFEVRIVDPPGLPADWQISLEDVSQHPGVCNNANIDDLPGLAARWQNAIKKNSPDLLFDFRRYGKTDKNFEPVSPPWKELHTTKAVAGVSVAVSCLDWGASGRISAAALVDGRWVDARCRETKENFVRIPWAPNDQLENKMAAAATTWRGQKKYFARDPTSDDDDTPAGKASCRGDGLTVFDEYRGFYVRRGGLDAAPEFIRLDPDHKDLFVYMFRASAQRLWRHVPDFEKASGLDVHRVGDDHLWRFVDFDASRLDDNKNPGPINFNSDHPKQCGLFMTISKLRDGVAGQSLIGPPVNVVMVEFDKGLRTDATNFFKSCVIHETGHAVGVDHHHPGPGGYFTVNAKGEQVATSLAGLLVAIEGGEWSGDEACAMKYTGAMYYTHRSTGPVTLWMLLNGCSLLPYDPKQIEKVGFAFCTNPRGTGLNDKSKPDWQCGDADLGNCRAQIVVNDACAGGGSGTQSRARGSGKTGDSPPKDETERSAIESQDRANISFELSGSRGRKTTLVRGGAAIFELNLSALPTKAAPELGAGKVPWTQQVVFLMLDSSGKLVPLSARVRLSGKVTRAALEGDNPQTSEETSPRIKLSNGQEVTVNFAIEPAESEKLSEKGVRIFAAVHSAGANAAPERVLSNSIRLEVEDPAKLPGGEKTAVEARRLLSLAELALNDGHFADAEILARQVIALTPHSAAAHLILARSLESQGKLREAYEEYAASVAEQTPRPGVVPEPPTLTIRAMQELQKKLGIHLEPITATLDMVFQHELYAEMHGGRTQPPFGKQSGKLVFKWKSTLPLGDAPLGARWIAEDVPGAEKNHVIVTAKSDPKETEGEFLITKPSTGFPPGQYRVEIWQTGKMIYSEKFEIKGD